MPTAFPWGSVVAPIPSGRGSNWSPEGGRTVKALFNGAKRGSNNTLGSKKNPRSRPFLRFWTSCRQTGSWASRIGNFRFARDSGTIAKSLKNWHGQILATPTTAVAAVNAPNLTMAGYAALFLQEYGLPRPPKR